MRNEKRKIIILFERNERMCDEEVNLTNNVKIPTRDLRQRRIRANLTFALLSSNSTRFLRWSQSKINDINWNKGGPRAEPRTNARGEDGPGRVRGESWFTLSSPATIAIDPAASSQWSKWQFINTIIKRRGGKTESKTAWGLRGESDPWLARSEGARKFQGSKDAADSHLLLYLKLLTIE